LLWSLGFDKVDLARVRVEFVLLYTAPPELMVELRYRWIPVFVIHFGLVRERFADNGDGDAIGGRGDKMKYGSWFGLR